MDSLEQVRIVPTRASGTRNTVLTVIIVTYNNADIIGQCLDSLAKLDAPEGLFPWYAIETIVVDNDSHDGTREILRSKIAELPNINLRLVYNRENVGLAKATNQAYRLATGDLLLFSNPDIIYNSLLIRMLKILSYSYTNDNSETVTGFILAPALLNLDGSPQNAIHRKRITFQRILWGWTLTGPWMDRVLLKGKMERDYRYPAWREGQRTKIDQAGSCMLMTMQTARSLFYIYDERLPLFFNDVELALRAEENGIETYIISDIKFRHYLSNSFKTDTRAILRYRFISDLIRFTKIRRLHSKFLKLVLFFDVIASLTIAIMFSRKKAWINQVLPTMIAQVKALYG